MNDVIETNAGDDPDQHWRKVTDSNSSWFTHADIARLNDGRDMVVKIVKAKAGKGKFQGGAKGGVILRFAGIERPLLANPTNATTLETLFGTGVYNKWIGRTITVYVGKAERGRKRGDPPPGPSESDKTIIVDCVRIRPRLPAADAVVYGVEPTAAAPFDLDGWLSILAGCTTVDDLQRARAELNSTAKPPKEHRDAIKAAIEEARVRIVGDPTL